MRKGLVIVLAAFMLLFAAAAAGAQSDNLIYNGDFEQSTLSSGLPKGWSFQAWDSGVSSAEVFSDSVNGNGVHIFSASDNDARITQTIQVKPNTCYQLSCDIKADGVVGPAGAGISVENTFATSKYIYQQSTWTRVVLAGYTGEDQHELTVALRIGGYGALASGEAWFDNMTVVEQETMLPGAVSFADLDDSYYHHQGSVISTDPANGGFAGFWWIVIVTVVVAALFVYFYRKKTFLGAPVQSLDKKEPSAYKEIWTILVAAFLLRAILSLVFVGHSTDITCFRAWSDAMVEGGPANFYTSGMFADYPPGYMYILWLLGAIRSLFGISSVSPVFVLMLKLPAIAADLASAYIIYRMARRFELSNLKALALMGLMAFNPAAMFISGAWGQVDSLLTLCVFAAIWSFMKQRRILAGLFFGIAVLLKPQALMFGPLFAAVLIVDIFGRGWKKRLLEVIASIVVMFAVIFLLALPFKSSQSWDWLLGKYFSTATSYPYASVEAFNLPALFGGNWTKVDKVPFLLSYGTWGTIFIVLSVVAAIALYIKERRKNPGALLLAAAFLIISVFTLGQYMHERYLFPALMLLLAAAFYYRDRRLYICFIWFSLTLLFNTLCAFIIVDNQTARGLMYDLMTRFCSLAQVLGLIYLIKVCFDLVTGRKRKEMPVEQGDTEEWKRKKLEIVSLGSQRKRFTRKDHLFCWILTGVYAVLALINLGTLAVPETYWEPQKVGESVTIEFSQPTNVREYWVYGNIARGRMILRTDEGHHEFYDQTYDEMFRWQRVQTDFESKSVTLVRYTGMLRLNEIAFFDAEGHLVNIEKVTSSGVLAELEDETSGYHLTDEQDMVPAAPSYLNGMYFDELYHARTAYEHLKGWDPYENSHPPLGKIFIMLGIAVFGMNPFGWRIVGTLFGIGMVPLIYLFAQKIFKKSEYALLAAVLFAFDFMHFTQTRIATIDVYGVFFIILMYYWMYRYYTMNFHVDGFKATLKPLALTAVFFALGAASKWICIYAGAGLAVLLIASLIRRYREYSYARSSGDEQAIRQTAHFWRYTIYTLLWCCLLFVIMPIIVYTLSYLPYMLCEKQYGLEKVWEYQEFMLSYHGNLTSTHAYQSAWWQWPFTFRPMWYYEATGLPAGYVSTLTASGSPAVWWVCTVVTLLLIVQRIRGKIKPDPVIAVLLVGCAANYLAWTLISRSTFIYHFFATVPFIVLSSVYLLEKMEEKYPYLAWVKYAWMILCVLLFALLYPGLSGAIIPRSYAAFLKHIPGGIVIKGV